MRVSIVGAAFSGRSHIGADCTGFFGSSAVPEITSLGISPASTNFWGRSAVRGDHTGFLGSSAVLGEPPWGSALLALSSQERVMLGQTVLASCKAALSWGRG